MYNGVEFIVEEERWKKAAFDVSTVAMCMETMAFSEARADTLKSLYLMLFEMDKPLLTPYNIEANQLYRQQQQQRQ